MAEESKLDLTNLTDRRKYMQEHLGEVLPELMQEIFGLDKLGDRAREIKPGVKIHPMIYHLANEPTTRHEVHWQLQSYVLVEILQVLKEIRNNLSDKPKGELKRRKV